MRLLDMSLATPAENVALDEALLEEAEAEAEAGPRETLRLWESARPLVVVGRGSRVDQEVDRDACQQREIPVLRRCSGGAAIVAGPGCLMYAVVLSYQRRPHLRSIEMAHQFVLQKIQTAVSSLASPVDIRGTSDLASQDRKFSGNSLRCCREHLLYHGTLLYDFPLPLVADCLRSPPREPDYRRSRDHLGFIANLNVDVAGLREAIVQTWSPLELATDWPRQRVRQLVAEKYSQPSWNLRHL